MARMNGSRGHSQPAFNLVLSTTPYTEKNGNTHLAPHLAPRCSYHPPAGLQNKVTQGNCKTGDPAYKLATKRHQSVRDNALWFCCDFPVFLYAPIILATTYNLAHYNLVHESSLEVEKEKNDRILKYTRLVRFVRSVRLYRSVHLRSRRAWWSVARPRAGCWWVRLGGRSRLLRMLLRRRRAGNEAAQHAWRAAWDVSVHSRLSLLRCGRASRMASWSHMIAGAGSLLDVALPLAIELVACISLKVYSHPYRCEPL